ncbi:hypothetical protein [Salinarimonas ramus]|uniref:Uncharacterized protein n=1 Tax=Salinarimonas ramus TaxID=690164 RepID=A0A917V4J8_9HYPH|nr:hypothetical protein [Salinarimonas ramus]GGK35803.1 hypothetical protein GCM10011322_23430 [Salinarimonas ramus]
MPGDKTEQRTLAQKALDLKRKNDPHAEIPEHRHSDAGMRPRRSSKAPSSGALDHGGATPAQSRSHGTRRSDQGSS